MLVKVCGITNQEDALHAVACGATHLGLIFVNGSPRQTDRDAAKIIVQAVKLVSKGAIVVGVFQNHSVEEIKAIVDVSAVDAIQLHGSEDAAFCRTLKEALGDNKVLIKAITIDPTESAPLASIIQPFKSGLVDYILFDKPKGYSSDADWLAFALTVIDALPEKPPVPYFFAGGLTADNLARIPDNTGIAGLDVASGVEKSPGKKDAKLVAAFVDTALKRGKQNDH